MTLPWETYAPLRDSTGLRHAFSLRSPVPDAELPALLVPSIHSLGWNGRAIVQAAQPHGSAAAMVSASDDGRAVPDVDTLATVEKGVVLAIRVADCGPVWLHDPIRGAVAVVHSGKKGTALNAVGAAVDLLKKEGSRPADLLAFLGPCIRPPHYEVDFVAEIARQAAAAGVGRFVDSGLDTAADLSRYYSYRAEKGQTGRMWAVAMLE